MQVGDCPVSTELPSEKIRADSTGTNVASGVTVQAIADSTTSLAEISVVPLDFLLILLLLFTFMVLDRLTYTLGSHLGKVPTSSSSPYALPLFFSCHSSSSRACRSQ